MLGVERIGRYEVLGHLASGGMGQVYLARTTGLGGFERQVVVKTLDVVDDEDQFVTMFLDEARLVGSLHHQYIAPVYEVGCDEDGRYFIVMDYIHGETAEAVWRRSHEGDAPAIPTGFALSVVYAVASALDYAHKLCGRDGLPLEIVHRDVSLSNIMIGYQGGVKLIDFGIAKSANRATKTVAGTLKGKFGYLSPEQILRQPVDHRTDVFALGIVLYELTTMERAFLGSSELMTLERITKGDYTPPNKHVANYPQALQAIVEQALAIDPAQRFQSAGEMAHEIESLARALGLALGDPAIIGTMHAFGRNGQTPSQRFARSSQQVRTDRELMARIEAEAAVRDDLTPVVAMPIMPTMPIRPTAPARRLPLALPLPAHLIPDATPTDLPSAVVANVPEEVLDDLTVPVVTPKGGTPLAIGQPQQLSLSYASALRPSTGTAKLLDRRTSRGLWIALVILAIVLGVVVAFVVH
ncbi:MAG: serine/threonine-protein kinase [Kofleriaceae bacterium]